MRKHDGSPEEMRDSKDHPGGETPNLDQPCSAKAKKKLKADKYCYELVQHAFLPKGFTPVVVAEHQQKIKSLLDSEKLARRGDRNVAQSDLRGTLIKQFEKNVKTLQKKAQTSIKGFQHSFYTNHMAVLNELRPDVPAGPQRVIDKVTATVRDWHYRNSNATVLHNNYDPVIEKFERQYNSLRPDLHAIKASIKKTLPHVIIVSDASHVEISLVDSNYDSLLIAVIYTGDARFRIKHTATADTRAISQHISNGREYVKDANNIFVKRYVYRNMASYDDSWTSGQFSSRNGLIPLGADTNQVIIKHLRAAQQGQSYFISFTTSKKRIFGSTGAEFYDPANGQAIVDLAKVAQARIYDVHTAQAVTGIITPAELRWGMQFVEGDDDYERNAAARDTVRTRELLIEGLVPGAGIVSLRRANVHGGAWRDLDGGAAKTNALAATLFPD
jgi:hypothetical protein